MRITIVLLLLFIGVSCGPAVRNSDYADKTNPCYQMHGNQTYRNGGDDISIYLGRVKSKGAQSWTASPYQPFEIEDPTFIPWVGFAAGFGFSVPAVEEVMVSLNAAAPVRYRRLKLNHPDYKLFTLEAKQEFWVPPSFPRHGLRVPELPQGDYRIQVRYRAKNFKGTFSPPTQMSWIQFGELKWYFIPPAEPYEFTLEGEAQAQFEALLRRLLRLNRTYKTSHPS